MDKRILGSGLEVSAIIRAVTGRSDVIPHVVDGTLRRLGVDAIDFYYQHRADLEVPIEDVAGAVKELIDAGKVKHFWHVRGRSGHYPPLGYNEPGERMTNLS